MTPAPGHRCLQAGTRPLTSTSVKGGGLHWPPRGLLSELPVRGRQPRRLQGGEASAGQALRLGARPGAAVRSAARLHFTSGFFFVPPPAAGSASEKF